MRIAELADRVGVPTSTVRYYERIRLLPPPTRTPSGYRDYDDAAAARLLFVARARRIGLSCEQIADLLPIWAGGNCEGARDRVVGLIERKQAEITEHVAELVAFVGQLEGLRVDLEQSPAPVACCADLSCCVPAPRTRAG